MPSTMSVPRRTARGEHERVQRRPERVERAARDRDREGRVHGAVLNGQVVRVDGVLRDARVARRLGQERGLERPAMRRQKRTPGCVQSKVCVLLTLKSCVVGLAVCSAIHV
jgi:hypothetical protein